VSVGWVILAGVTTIPWAELQPAQVQKIISALLVRTVDGAKPVEGAGGDDGADVVAPVSGGEHVYEIKSFVGRLGTPQRRQIRDSLRTARKRRPTMLAWTLVLPTELTPGEQRWFNEKLSAEVAVPVDWMGRIAIEAAFAERPDLARAFLPGSAERRALELLVQQGQETAALAHGVSEAVARGVALRNLTSTIDPDWDYDLEFAADQATIHLRPKDPGAAERSPIMGALQMQAPIDSPEARAIEDFHVYGAPLELGPDNVSLLDLRLPSGLAELLTDQSALTSLSIGAEPGPADRLYLVGTHCGKVVDRLPLLRAEVTHGPMGGRRVVLYDDAKIFRLELRIQPLEESNTTPGGAEFEVKMRPDVLPAEAIPTMQFIAGLSGCDGLRLEMAGQSAAPLRLTEPVSVESLVPVSEFINLLQALQRVQDATGVPFGVPVLTANDQQMLHFADRLLADGQVSWSWPGMIVPATVDGVRQVLAGAALIPTMNATGTGDGRIQIAGHDLDLGGEITMTVTNAVVVNPAALACAIRQEDCPPLLDIHVGAMADTEVVFHLLPRPTDGTAAEPVG
jgi:hypothetical protein